MINGMNSLVSITAALAAVLVLIWLASRVARFGGMATLIGNGIGIDDVAEASESTGREILSRLGRRVHRIYYAT